MLAWVNCFRNINRIEFEEGGEGIVQKDGYVSYLINSFKIDPEMMAFVTYIIIDLTILSKRETIYNITFALFVIRKCPN